MRAGVAGICLSSFGARFIIVKGAASCLRTGLRRAAQVMATQPMPSTLPQHGGAIALNLRSTKQRF